MGTFRFIRALFSDLQYRIFCKSLSDELSSSEFVPASGTRARAERTYVFLKQALPRVPYWWRGHVHFARVCLELSRGNEALLACLAAEKLLQGKQRVESVLQELKGRSLVQMGLYEEALSVFQEKTTLSHREHEVAASAEFGLGRLREALERLSRLPDAQLSGDARAAKKFLSQKLSEEGGTSEGGGSSCKSPS